MSELNQLRGPNFVVTWVSLSQVQMSSKMKPPTVEILQEIWTGSEVQKNKWQCHFKQLAFQFTSNSNYAMEFLL